LLVEDEDRVLAGEVGEQVELVRAKDSRSARSPHRDFLVLREGWGLGLAWATSSGESAVPAEALLGFPRELRATCALAAPRALAAAAGSRSSGEDALGWLSICVSPVSLAEALTVSLVTLGRRVAGLLISEGFEGPFAPGAAKSDLPRFLSSVTRETITGSLVSPGKPKSECWGAMNSFVSLFPFVRYRVSRHWRATPFCEFAGPVSP